ncbi:hypothetical protein KI387_027195 [Taxus chinensis]|uniref:Uncharacterized protein n=1 Tax=Taxus chinensis TaxID=29808 RepID=A0AA38FXS4_TAXCH|nr:hypothetical protein KI387_027195 [Taxus chinensis]
MDSVETKLSCTDVLNAIKVNLNEDGICAVPDELKKSIANLFRSCEPPLCPCCQSSHNCIFRYLNNKMTGRSIQPRSRSQISMGKRPLITSNASPEGLKSVKKPCLSLFSAGETHDNPLDVDHISLSGWNSRDEINCGTALTGTHHDLISNDDISLSDWAGPGSRLADELEEICCTTAVMADQDQVLNISATPWNAEDPLMSDWYNAVRAEFSSMCWGASMEMPELVEETTISDNCNGAEIAGLTLPETETWEECEGGWYNGIPTWEMPELVEDRTISDNCMAGFDGVEIAELTLPETVILHEGWKECEGEWYNGIPLWEKSELVEERDNCMAGFDIGVDIAGLTLPETQILQSCEEYEGQWCNGFFTDGLEACA